MSGFSLYETLRIFIPGVLAVLIADIVMRLGFGPHPFVADSTVKHLTTIIENPAAAVAIALLIGLILYMIDLPARILICKEGAENYEVPSKVLGRLLDGKKGPNPLGLYIIISDQYLPAETRRQVYLFGSLFRVYVDLRVLLAVGATAGPAAALISTSIHPHYRLIFSATGLGAILAVLIAIILLGSWAQRDFAFHFIRKAQDTWKRQKGNPLTLKEFEACYRLERNLRIKAFMYVPLLLTITGLLAVSLLLTSNPLLQAGGASLLILQLIFWFWVEIGRPEAPLPSERRRLTLRSNVLLRLGGVHRDSHFWPIQRLLAEIALFAPWLFAAAVAGGRQGRDPLYVTLWGLLIIPAVLIMAFRKHEVRLLMVYGDQCTWLRMHREDIEHLRDTNQLPDRWGKPPLGMNEGLG